MVLMPPSLLLYPPSAKFPWFCYIRSLSAFMFPTNKITIDSFQRFASLITHSIATKNLSFGQHLHSHLIKTALTSDTFLSNRLIDLYSKCGSIANAHKVFHHLPFKNTFSWNTLIAGCLNNALFDDAYKLFDEMPEPNIVSYNSIISGLTRHGFHKQSIVFFKTVQAKCGAVVFDEFTFATMVGSCACLSDSRLLSQLHAMAVLIGLEFNAIICNTLIDAYGKCRQPDLSYIMFSNMPARDVVSWTSMVVAYSRASRLDDARRVFNQMEVKNTVTWTALIAGLAQNGHGKEALDLFVQMQRDRVRANSYTYVAVLGACADLALTEKGKQIHCHVIRSILTNDVEKNVYIYNALLDLYCKSGDMRSARYLFEKMPAKDTVSWNSMITGYAQNGLGGESVGVFQKMMQAGERPNHITFLSVLSGCSHSGLLSEGMRIFDMMASYGLKARSEHYAIVIDLLGRNNKLEEAVSLIERAPNGSDHVGIWGALLGASRVHGDLELARRAAEVLFELEPGNAGRYTMMSNVYSEAKRWEDADQVRHLMSERRLRKDTAFSWIEVKNSRQEFVAHDKSHFRGNEIYGVIHGLVDQMTESGCRFRVKGFVIEDEELFDN